MNLKITTIMIFSILLLSASISAAEFDNIKEFNESIGDYGKIKIKNWFGVGEDLADLTLNDNTDSCEENCHAIKEIKLYKESVLIDDIKFETIREDGSRIEQPIRNYQFYLQTSQEQIEVEDYEYRCSVTGVSQNGSNIIECSNVLVGTHFETEAEWIPYQIGTQLPIGTYTLKLEGEKKPSRSVDWIVKSQGQWLDEWAVWGGTSLLSDSTNYWKLDESSGLNALDIRGGQLGDQRNITFINQATYTSGLINNGINLDGTDDYGSTSATLNSLNGTKDATISAWINVTSAQTGAIFSIVGGLTHRAIFQSGGNLRIFWAGGDTATVGSGIATDGTEWNHVVVITQGNRLLTYLNNALIANVSAGSSLGNANFRLGSDGTGGDDLFGMIDEVGVWNKSLSPTEISTLYNSGAGYSFDNFEPGTITLNSPANNSLSNNSTVTFNGTATPGGSATLTNMSLYHNASGTWERNQTNIVTGNTNTTTFEASFADGNYLWTIEACDSDGDCGFGENWTVSLDQTLPNITIFHPGNNLSGLLGSSIDLNYSVVDVNLDTCWYEYAGTNTTIADCTANTTFTLSYQQTLNFWANDTLSQISNKSITWTGTNAIQVNLLDINENAISPVQYWIEPLNTLYPNQGYYGSQDSIEFNNLSFFDDADPYSTNLTVIDGSGRNQDLTNYSLVFNSSIGEYNITLVPKKLALLFVNDSNNLTNTSGIVSEQYNFTYTFTNTNNYTVDQLNVSEGKVKVTFNLKNDTANETYISQYYEYVNDLTTYEEARLLILLNLDKKITFEVTDTDKKKIPETKVKIHCRKPSSTAEPYLLVGQRFTDSEGRVDFYLDESYSAADSSQNVQCIATAIKPGYETYSDPFYTTQIDNTLVRPINLVRTTLTPYNNIWMGLSQINFNENTTSISGSYYYTSQSASDGIRVSTYYAETNGLERTVPTPSQTKSEVYDFTIIPGTHFDSSLEDPIILMTFQYTNGDWVNVRNDTLPYFAPKQIADVKSLTTSTWVLSVYLILLLIIAGLAGVITTSENSGATVLLVGMILTPFLMDHYYANVLAILAWLVFGIKILRGMNKE